MRALGRDPALGRHPRVAERVGAAQVVELERVREHLRQADVLVDLDHLPALMIRRSPRAARTRASASAASAGTTITAWLARTESTSPPIAAATARQSSPRCGRVERQLRHPVRDRVAIDGDAGAVRPAVAHLREHRHEVHAEVLLDRGRLREQPDDPAHQKRVRYSRTSQALTCSW